MTPSGNAPGARCSIQLIEPPYPPPLHLMGYDSFFEPLLATQSQETGHSVTPETVCARRRPSGGGATCDPLLISRSPLNCKHSLMSGLEAQQMSNWSDNYHHGALMSLSAAPLLTSDAAFRWSCTVFFQIYDSSLKRNEQQTANI